KAAAAQQALPVEMEVDSKPGITTDAKTDTKPEFARKRDSAYNHAGDVMALQLCANTTTDVCLGIRRTCPAILSRQELDRPYQHSRGTIHQISIFFFFRHWLRM